MFENENNNGFVIGGDLDLGSSSGDFSGFTAINDAEAAAIFGQLETKEEPKAEPKEEIAEVKEDNAEPVQVMPEHNNAQQADMFAANTGAAGAEENKNETVTDSGAKEASGEVQPENSTAEPADLFSAVMAEADEKQAEAKKSELMEKLPFFEHGGAKEEIVDTSKTFDELRLEKAEDFPELDEGENVKWKVTYGPVVKQVANAKKTTIASIKKQIEESDEFMKYLKKPADDKKTKAKKSKGDEKSEIECKVIPIVTAKKKGVLEGYKGLSCTVDEALQSGKLISYVPSDDGRMFEVRNNKIGTFIAPIKRVTAFKKVKAGFTPALPKIPYKMWSEIISFFKSFVSEKGEVEALAYIYWSFIDEKYYVVIPKQTVTKDSVDSFLPDVDENNFILVAEMHSHNTMPAFFSHIDDRDEKATRVYIVVGRMDKIFPDIKARISCGGKFVKINPSVIMEGYECEYPHEWKDKIEEYKPKKWEACL